MTKTSTKQKKDESISASTAVKLTPTEELNPSELLLRQDFTQMIGVKREVLTVPIKRPNRQEWFFIHPNPAWRAQVALLEDKQTRDVYIVAPCIQEELLGDWSGRLLVACQTRNSSPFLWMIRIPDDGGRLDSWNESAMQILEEHSGHWIRIAANRQIGAYDVFTPIGDLALPEWTGAFDELLRKAFRGKVIDNSGHPFIRALRGET
jgi:hypothetical protein